MKLQRFNQFIAHHWSGGMSASELFDEFAEFDEEEKKDMAEMLAMLMYSEKMEEVEKEIDLIRSLPDRTPKRRK